MKNFSIGLMTAFMMSGAQAATMSFNNGSGVYNSAGVTATVSVTKASSAGGLHYNGVENAIGVGKNNTDGGIGFNKLINAVPNFTEKETMTVTFSQEVILDTVWFRQWENDVLGFGDEVHFDYTGGTSGSGSILFSNSGVGDGPLLDPFTAGVSLMSFTIRSEQDGNDPDGVSNETSVYLHSVDFTIPTVAEVPLPAAAWLFGSALLGLVTAGGRRRALV